MKTVSLTTHFAFRASDDLHGHVDGFLTRQAAGSTRKEPETIEAIMQHLVAEVLDAYLTTTANRVGLDRKGKRIIDTTTKTVNKAANFVMARAVHKLDLDQHRGIADYMASLRLLHEGGAISSVAFPVGDDLASHGRAVTEKVMDGGGAKGNRELLVFMNELLDVGADYYLDQPLRIMKFGPVLRSVSTTSTSAIRKAVQFAIKELVPTLNKDQSVELATYLSELIQDHPVGDPTPLGRHAV